MPKQRFREIMQMMIDNQYNFKWNSFYRSDQGDSETIALMARAGCEGQESLDFIQAFRPDPADAHLE